MRFIAEPHRPPLPASVAALALVIAILMPVLTAACGDGADTPGAATPAGTGTPQAFATVLRSPTAINQFSIRDAALFRDALLELSGKSLWDVSKVNDGFGAFPVWRAQYPDLGIYTPAAPADALRVSVYVNTLIPGTPASNNNPYTLAFAVMDSQGRCAAGSVVGYPAPSRYGRVEPPPPTCTGFAVADILQSAVRATPTP